VIALTASALKGEAERCLAAGMDDYLAKPVGIPALVQMLARWLPHTQRGAEVSPAPVPVADPHAELAAMLPQAERPAPIDEAVLAGLTRGDAAETRELLDDFLASTTADLAALEAARDAGDLAGVTREAHKMKGAARSIGAGELGEAADALETAGRAQDAAHVPALAADVATAVHRMRLWVDARWPH
jgi:HPt (histidine-containing phosphotransfer) domain-containing protein